MNSNIILEGRAETITNASAAAVPSAAQSADIANQLILAIEAETDLVISALTFNFPMAPAHPNKVVAFTLKAGRTLFRVKSVTFTGTATVYYKY